MLGLVGYLVIDIKCFNVLFLVWGITNSATSETNGNFFMNCKIKCGKLPPKWSRLKMSLNLKIGEVYGVLNLNKV
jgi:hypothetical protein